MKRLHLAVSFLFVISLAHAVGVEEWSTEVSVENDRSTEWIVSLAYKENVTRSDYFVLARVTGVEVKADGSFIDCSVTDRGLGTSIVCENINASKVTYRFRALGLVNALQDLNTIKYRVSVTEITDKFYLTVKLPLGTGLVEKTKIQGTGLKQYEPEWGKEGSDGRRIFVQWSLDRPVLGRTIDISIIYENILDAANITSILIIAIIVIVFLAVIIILRKREIKDVLPVLTENERKVMEILIKEKKEVDQKRIVKELDYSKSKVSRIVQNLQTRGLMEIRRKGRTNMLSLKMQK